MPHEQEGKEEQPSVGLPEDHLDGPDPMVHGRTREEWRALGSAEVNMWTITPPGGQPMSLSEYAAVTEAQSAQQAQETEEWNQTHDEEARVRREQREADA